MRDAVIVEAARTPVGRRRGALSGIHPADLSAQVLRALVDRTGVDPALVDDVVWGCVSQVGEQAVNIGRSAVHTAVLAADDPVIMLTAPIPATEKALKKSGLAIGDIGAIEVNEAFAPVPLAWLAETGADPAVLNSRGGAIALGHPLGGSGARLMTTLVHRMHTDGVRYGLQTMCEGGGMANATILERL